jgi:F-type H+-transporting ATPase subunit gamma
MPSLKEVRNRIVSINSTQQITKAMKMVSAAKLRRAQDAIVQMRPYAQRLSGILNNLSAAVEDNVTNPFAQERAPERVLIIAITSDRGLAGAFNTNVMKGVLAQVQERYPAQAAAGRVTIMPVGKKGMDAFSRRRFPVISEYSTLFVGLNFAKARTAAEFAMNGFLNGTYDRVDIVYNEFRNVATQIVKREQFLPILPAPVQQQKGNKIDYIFEPSQAEIFQELVPKSLKVQFYRALLESNASEHGARMTAMDKATDNAKELLKELRLQYNRSRQAAITKEILEIVGGAEALASS